MPKHPGLVSTGQAAYALNITAAALRRLRAAGVAVPAAFTDGGHARWDVDDLREQPGAYLDTLGQSED